MSYEKSQLFFISSQFVKHFLRKQIPLLGFIQFSYFLQSKQKKSLAS